MRRTRVSKVRLHSAEQIAAAREYVNAQIATMTRFGHAPDLTPEKYEQVVLAVLRALPRRSA